MALNAAIEWDVRVGGSDNNGGGFKAGAAGTDRSQQASAQVAIDNATITTSIATNVITFTGGYTATAADVGNVVQMLTGTNVTAGFYEVTGQTSSTWTMDRNVVTSGTTTDATGNMGGALASPGMAAGAKVSGNTIWLKYSATTYDVSTTSSNVTNGRVDINATSVRLEGYETTHGDLSANRPTIKATTNTMTLFTQSSGSGYFANFIVDAGAATGILGVSTGASTTTYRVKAVACNSTAGFSCGSGSVLIECEASGGSVPGFRMNGATLWGCVVEGCSTDAFEAATNQNACINCIADSGTGSADGYGNNGASSRLHCENCVAYANAGNGFNNAGQAHGMMMVNCIADSNTSTGIGAGNATVAIQCAVRNNGTNVGTNVVGIGTVILTADPFTNAASDDFSLNNTAGGGADCRSAGALGAFPGILASTGYLDIGAVQHQATTTNIFKSAVGRWSF